MAGKGWIAIDWDHCLWDTANRTFLPGAVEAIANLRDRGFKVLIHSCNKPPFIRQMLDDHGVRVDGIWGESPADAGHKPVAGAYIDDRGVPFRGDWPAAIRATFELLETRG